MIATELGSLMSLPTTRCSRESVHQSPHLGEVPTSLPGRNCLPRMNAETPRSPAITRSSLPTSTRAHDVGAASKEIRSIASLYSCQRVLINARAAPPSSSRLRVTCPPGSMSGPKRRIMVRIAAPASWRRAEAATPLYLHVSSGTALRFDTTVQFVASR